MILDDVFISVIEAMVFNYDFGKTLIISDDSMLQRINIPISRCSHISVAIEAQGIYQYSLEYLREVEATVRKRIREIEAKVDKYDTIICQDIFLSYNISHAIRNSYIDTVLCSLNNGGRLLITVPNVFMKGQYSKEIRNTILNGYQLNKVVCLKFGEFEKDIIYILDVSNTKFEECVHYYNSSMFISIDEMLYAIREHKNYIEVPRDDFEQRWDSNFVNPKYDELRKKYLSKDTVKLGSIAKVVSGVPIVEKDHKESGEYLVLTPRLATEDGINYYDDTAFYTDPQDNHWFESAILKDGDIVVCNVGLKKKNKDIHILY